MRTQQVLDDEGRTGVDLQRGALVEGAHQVQVDLQCGRQRRRIGGRGRQLQQAVARFAAGACVVAVQSVQAGAGMGVDHRERRVLLGEVLHGGNQHRVLEHIGVVACMEGVAVTEHAPMVTKRGAPALALATDGMFVAVSERKRSGDHSAAHILCDFCPLGSFLLPRCCQNL